ncbi:MAG: orotate phosphoribosyltransferase [Bacteroidales bacterium]|nr:orotate phosphoribosyltransferase [Bacteroidales bacterium]MDE7466442.1 orotate phosphoribosyltransferase [Muribaculaceae bacterium]
MKKPERLLAEKFLQASAIKLQPDIPFVWGSGWNSPIYNDHRRLLSYPTLRNLIKIEIAKIVIEQFPEAQAIASVSTGAIPMGTLVADALGFPFAYVRDTPKDHGLENRIEGNLRPGWKVVLFEDLITTGANSVKAKEAVEANGCEAVGLITAFSYEFPMAVKRLKDADIRVTSLFTYEEMLQAAVDMEYIRPADLSVLELWRTDPAGWAPNNDRNF